jgi:hypothetical protein
VLALSVLAAPGPPAKSTGLAGSVHCDMTAASPSIRKWLEAWELASGQILHLPDAPPPTIILYDSSCVFTTSVTAPGAASVRGPTLRGARLPWRAMPHGDSITTPNGKRLPVQLMSFTDNDPRTGPYFVMAAPSYWATRVGGDPQGYTAVFLHEFAHTRQLAGFAGIIGPID